MNKKSTKATRNANDSQCILRKIVTNYSDCFFIKRIALSLNENIEVVACLNSQ